MKNIFFCISFFILFACGKQKTEQINPDVDLFFQVYESYLLLIEGDALSDSQKTVMLDSALNKHNMSTAQFDSTLNYMESHPREFYQRFSAFSRQLEDTLKQSPPD